MKVQWRLTPLDGEATPSLRHPASPGLVSAVCCITKAVAATGCSLFFVDDSTLLGLALAGVDELGAGQLHEGLQDALDPDPSLDSKHAVRSALEVRAALALVAQRLRGGELGRALDELDEQLDGTDDALNLLLDDEYLAAVRGVSVDETRWWGRRAAVIRALPMDVLECALQGAGPGEEEASTACCDPPVVALDEVQLVGEPLTDLSVDAVYSIHRAAFPVGLAPSREVIRRMLARDRVFGARVRGELVPVLHARVLPAGSSMAATDIEDHDGRRPTAELFAPLETAEPFVVCHAAVTHPDHRGARITQRLIAGVVLPYFASHPELRELAWFTSSPLTHFVSTGRRLAATQGLAELVEVSEPALGAVRPNGWCSFGELIAEAWPWLSRSWLADADVDGRRIAADPPAFFALLYAALPTHEELAGLQQRDERAFAALAARVTRLYSRSEDRAAHAASFVLLFLAAAFTQAGVYRESGRPADPILAFHLGNGARLAGGAGVLPNSRRADLAALRFGQVVEYPRSWACERERNLELFAARARGHGGVQVDRDFASQYLPRCIGRTPDVARAALGAAAPSPARLCRDGLVRAA